jgi:hypothetical protein
MIDLFIGFLSNFLVAVFVLPCLVISAMSIRGIRVITSIYNPSGLNDRRARNFTEIAGMNASVRSASMDEPSITRGEVAHQLLSFTTPLYSTRIKK